MDYKKIETGSYNLHLIHTNRFKTITIRICLKDEIKKEEITLRNFLSSFLTYSTNTYQTKRDIVLHAQDLYAANIYTKSYRAGNYNMINFYLSTLAEKFTEEGMLEESIKFLADIIFNPNFNNEGKMMDAYNFLYHNLETEMKGIKENPTLYSAVRMLEVMDKDMPYSYREYGYLEDLEKITPAELKDYYKKIINNSLVDIYVIGEFDDDNIINLIDKYIVFETFKRPKKSQIINHKTLPKRIKIEHEETDGNQSKLTIGCKIGDLTEYELNYALTIYNLVLGGNSEAKLFRIIREEHSLAYYIYSSLYKLDHLMLIKAGISRENFDKTLKLVKKLMKEMENGNFTDKDIEFAKNSYLSMLKEVEDSQNAIIETYVAKDLLNLGDIEERKKMIMNVTKEEIVNVAKKVKMDTVFLLEGASEDEGN